MLLQRNDLQSLLYITSIYYTNISFTNKYLPYLVYPIIKKLNQIARE